ncbi:MAG: dihydroxyacetone kinase subunit DhaK [Selenomonadaceae bacterium]|nr:dihydroxyacetone kinase subunit DhaK [Selenomonadaceae bacterium]
MKKVINNVSDIEKELLEGLATACPKIVRKLRDQNIIVRAILNPNKVAIVSGGGSGHEPAHAGYVGYGMLDCAVSGSIFTSPPVSLVFKAICEVANEKGVLCIVKNYTGDIMSFDLAIDMARSKGIKVDRVIVDDDIAVTDNLVGRRGVAGTILVHKIAGAAAEAGLDLETIKEIAQRTINNVRTIGVALKLCTVPAVGKPGFDVPDTEMEFGIGIHGEPGIRQEQITSADGIARKMLDKLLSHIYFAGNEVVVLINGMGATPMMELLIVSRFVNAYLYRNAVKIHDTLVGNYMTSIDMAGFSISLLKLDDNLRAFYDASAITFALKK